MDTDASVIRLLNWLWDNPWYIIAALGVIAATALILSKRSNLSYLRGIPRCHSCMDARKTQYKVAYGSKAKAEAAAHRYRRQFGYQQPYYQPTCGYWHLTSQNAQNTRNTRNTRNTQTPRKEQKARSK